MQHIDQRTINSIQRALDGDVIGSDFKDRNYLSDDRVIYSLEIEIEELDNNLSAMFDPEKDAMVFEFTWYNFATEAGPTAAEMRKELQILEEVRGEIEEVVEPTPYEFSRGVLNQDNYNPTGRQPVLSNADRFSPSVLHEGDDMCMSIGISRGDAETPF